MAQPEYLEQYSASAWQALRRRDLGESEPPESDNESEDAQGSGAHSHWHGNDWQGNDDWQGNAWYHNDWQKSDWQGDDGYGDAWHGNEWYDNAWRGQHWQARDPQHAAEEGGGTCAAAPCTPTALRAPATPETPLKNKKKEAFTKATAGQNSRKVAATLGKKQRSFSRRRAVADVDCLSLKDILSTRALGQGCILKVTYVPTELLSIPKVGMRKMVVQLRDPEMSIEMRSFSEEAVHMEELFRGREGQTVYLEPVVIGYATPGGTSAAVPFLKCSAQTKVEELQDAGGTFAPLSALCCAFSDLPDMGDYRTCNITGIVQSCYSPIGDLTIFNVVDNKSRLVKVQAWHLAASVCSGDEISIYNAEVDLVWKRLNVNTLTRIVVVSSGHALPSNVVDLAWPQYDRPDKGQKKRPYPGTA